MTVYGWTAQNVINNNIQLQTIDGCMFKKTAFMVAENLPWKIIDGNDNILFRSHGAGICSQRGHQKTPSYLLMIVHGNYGDNRSFRPRRLHAVYFMTGVLENSI